MKISWPQINGTGSRQSVSTLRTELSIFARIAERSADYKNSLVLHVQALLGALPGILAAVVTNNQVMPMATNAGAIVSATGASLSVAANGVISFVRPSSAIYPVFTGTKIIMPQATGTYVNGYTFTVAGGVITAIVAS